MEPIKVSVDVTVDLSESAKAFVTALFAKSSTTVSDVPATNAKPVAPAKPASEAPAAPAKLVAPAKPTSEALVATAKPAASAPASTITIEDVRKALSEKVNAHRNEIKDKLSELGAPSVTKLDQSKYQEMYDFLIALD